MRYLIGIGNYYGFDDSIGLRIAEHVAEQGLDRDFRAIELGGNVLDLVHYLEADTEAVLVVDAARMGVEPGEYAFFQPGEVATRKQRSGLSTHESDLLEVVQLGGGLGRTVPPMTVLGIEPAEIRSEAGLSEVLAGRFGEYVEAALGFFEAID